MTREVNVRIAVPRGATTYLNVGMSDVRTPKSRRGNVGMSSYIATYLAKKWVCPDIRDIHCYCVHGCATARAAGLRLHAHDTCRRLCTVVNPLI